MATPLTCSLVVGHTVAPSRHTHRRHRWTRLPCSRSASRRLSSFFLDDSWCRLLLSTTLAFPERNPPRKQSSHQLRCAQCLQSSISFRGNVFYLTFLPQMMYSMMGGESVCREDPCPGTLSATGRKDRDPSGGSELVAFRSSKDTSSMIGCRCWPSTSCWTESPNHCHASWSLSPDSGPHPWTCCLVEMALDNPQASLQCSSSSRHLLLLRCSAANVVEAFRQLWFDMVRTCFITF